MAIASTASPAAILVSHWLL